MIRSSFAAKGIGLCLIVLGSIACGDKPPPKPPETTPSSEDGGAGETKAEGSADAGGGGTETAAKPEEKPAAPAALPMPTAAAKLTFKTKAAYTVEVKSDGAVTSGGKPAAKVMGMELQDDKGKTALKVDGDNIANAEGGPYAKFEGDDLVALNGVKYNIGDDGALSSTDDKGKKAALGKSEGVGAAKRTALLAVAFVMWGQKAPAAPAGKADPKKPGDKPAGDKPAEKKPAGKPAGKK